MDILVMVDLYYMTTVMVLSYVANAEIGKLEWNWLMERKQIVVLFIALVLGIGFVAADYFLGVEDLSQSYKRLLLTFLVSIAFHDFIIKLVLKQLK